MTAIFFFNACPKGDTFCEVTFKEHWVNAYVFKLDGKYYGPPSFKEKNYERKNN